MQIISTVFSTMAELLVPVLAAEFWPGAFEDLFPTRGDLGLRDPLRTALFGRPYNWGS